MVSVGEKVPYFELPDQQGYPWSLSGELEVGPVVLVFYRGDWCAYCNGQLASYARRFAEFERRGARVAGVSVDPPDDNARLVGKLRLPFPLLSDPRGELLRRLRLWDERAGVAKPSVLVLDRSGEVRYLYSGSDFADRPRDEDVFTALKGMDASIERITGGPEIVVSATVARESSVRPNKVRRVGSFGTQSFQGGGQLPGDASRLPQSPGGHRQIRARGGLRLRTCSSLCRRPGTPPPRRARSRRRRGAP
ncbi:MAG: AhpC/TSA family [Rubrobacteraceae bacterium]|nr:AhpC/TSA family [Rubrobacteraceae bacterium]